VSTIATVLVAWTAASLVTCVPIARLVSGPRLVPVGSGHRAEPVHRAA
jgi:hypothetical protein